MEPTTDGGSPSVNCKDSLSNDVGEAIDDISSIYCSSIIICGCGSIIFWGGCGSIIFWGGCGCSIISWGGWSGGGCCS